MVITTLLRVLVFVCTVNLVFTFDSDIKNQIRGIGFPPCRACKLLVESFRKGMKRTETGKFEGGDAAWEEEKLGSYATSELRFIEIEEKICDEIEEGRQQCFSLAETNEELLEKWFLKHQQTEPDLYKWFCIDTIRSCCPNEHYGKDCLPCPGHPGNVCSKNGKCRGSGTRKGNGTCDCDVGYTDDMCSTCASQYYVSYEDAEKTLCSRCHVSCLSSCTEAGPKGCIDCSAGWIKDEEHGCMDVNECAHDAPVCKSAQFCVNTDGSYKCLDCDRACLTCSGDGPDMCFACAPGYTLINQICVDTKEQQRTSYVHYTRYLTYIGLTVATCIIFQKNVLVAAIVGLAVAIYISLSEYILSTSSNSPNI